MSSNFIKLVLGLCAVSEVDLRKKTNFKSHLREVFSFPFFISTFDFLTSSPLFIIFFILFHYYYYYGDEKSRDGLNLILLKVTNSTTHFAIPLPLLTSTVIVKVITDM